jgi:hypothetical protein
MSFQGSMTITSLGYCSTAGVFAGKAGQTAQAVGRLFDEVETMYLVGSGRSCAGGGRE